jgi:hypothetical protein
LAHLGTVALRPLRPCRAAPLGCSATTLGACFIGLNQNGPTDADNQRGSTCPWSAGIRGLGKAESAQARATDRIFSRHHPSRTSLQSSHLDFTVHRACANLPRTPPLDPYTSCSLAFAPPIGPVQSLLTARESHVLHLLACAGMAVNIHGVHIEQAQLLLGATAAPAVRFRSASAGPLQAAGWWTWRCSHAVGSGATSSSPLTMIKG